MSADDLNRAIRALHALGASARGLAAALEGLRNALDAPSPVLHDAACDRLLASLYSEHPNPLRGLWRPPH